MELDLFLNKLTDLKLYRQSRVTRWQLRDYVFTENDAEHQLYVSQLIVIINKLFNIPSDSALKALSYGCCHDYVESTEDSFGDVNYALKEKNPQLKALVKAQERLSMKNVDAFYDSLIKCEQDELASLVVDLADSLDALLYVNRECKFNVVKDEWLEIQSDVYSRVVNDWNLLEELCDNRR